MIKKEKPQFLKDPRCKELIKILNSKDDDSRYVGGCVRDYFTSHETKDIDIATKIPPNKVVKILTKNGYKPFTAGIDHGTISINLGELKIEITTLRKDMNHDGRHADIELTDDWEIDAARRDFTINSLYMNDKGDLFDPFDGLNDLKNRKITASFDGVIGKKDFSNDIEVSESSILINLEDASTLLVDVDIPEIYAPFINRGLAVDVKFSGNKKKIYKGIVDSTASRIDTEKRSLAARISLDNSKLEILPGSLLEITIKYNERSSLSIPDTSVILEGNKVYIYKVNKDNQTIKKEITIGTRDEGYLEVISGLKEGEIIVAEGLKKVRPNGKIKPINK